MLRIRFTTDVHVTSTRPRHHLWRLPVDPPWETRQRSTSRRALDAGVSAMERPGTRAGPPRGHPASSGSVLDGTSPASARSTATLLLGGWLESSGALSASWASVDASLWHLFGAAGSVRLEAPFPGRMSPFWPAARQCGLPFPSPRCLPPWKTDASALSGARAARCSRWPAGAAAAPVHRGSKTPTRPLFACSSRAS
jgi:hypothetical protein